jgi:sec-independent protein translocase protein TatC
MATALKPIGHEDRLTIVDHLDELRTRLIVCAITLAVAFGVCFWQNGALIDVLNKPLRDSTPTAQSNGRLARVAQAQLEVQKGLAATARSIAILAGTDNLGSAQRRQLAGGGE